MLRDKPQQCVRGGKNLKSPGLRGNLRARNVHREVVHPVEFCKVPGWGTAPVPFEGKVELAEQFPRLKPSPLGSERQGG